MPSYDIDRGVPSVGIVCCGDKPAGRENDSVLDTDVTNGAADNEDTHVSVGGKGRVILSTVDILRHSDVHGLYPFKPVAGIV